MGSEAKTQTPLDEPRRIKKFRLELVNAIPRFPNNRASLEHMQQKHLADVMIDYVNWRSRYVGARPRQVTVEPTAMADSRWSSKSAAIESFLDKVRRGDDLSAHLSIKPHTQGYTPVARATGATSEEKWLDKDFVLNTKGYHHFHLGTEIEKKGHTKRTDDILFAKVTRDQFTVIAILTHEVFDLGSAEQMRLGTIHQEIAFQGLPPGSVVVMGNVTTSGHAMSAVFYARHCVRLLRNTDPKLDNPEFMKSLYQPREEAPEKSKPEWTFMHLDLAVYDKAKPGILVLQKGWN